MECSFAQYAVIKPLNLRAEQGITINCFQQITSSLFSL
jgi:hypothetical protein